MEQTTKVITGKVRLSYAHLWEPSAIKEGQPKKYSASLIIPKSDLGTIKKIQDAIELATAQGKTDKWGGKIPPNLKLPLRDGDKERPEDPAYKNSYFINANSAQQPGMLDTDKSDMAFNKTGMYSGCYAKVSINLYPYDANGSKGVACGLNNILKVADGPALSGRARAEDDFKDVEADDEEDI